MSSNVYAIQSNINGRLTTIDGVNASPAEATSKLLELLNDGAWHVKALPMNGEGPVIDIKVPNIAPPKRKYNRKDKTAKAKA